jgi:hypothetical protein
MIDFNDIKERLTGISCPICGISWNPPESDKTIANRIIRFLEDRRVLYIPSEMEIPHQCVDSVIKIREYLTKELQVISSDSHLYEYVKAMRIACRKFTEKMTTHDDEFLNNARQWNHWASWSFASALGELRGTFGNMIVQISAAYGINIENDLALIIPEKK